MRAINWKMLRDLNNMRAMVFVIAIMIVSGVATFVTLLSTLDSLRSTQRAYYNEYYFSNIFASLKRAPSNVASRIREIPGINRIEVRIFAGANIDVAGFDEPIRGLIISVPDVGEPVLNRLYLREGRMPAPYSLNEVVVGDAFVQAHHLTTGDRMTAVINGRKKEIKLVGVGLSPEFIYQANPGSIIPDFERFAIIWMGRSALESAYDMQGAFNNITASLTYQANEAEVIQRVDDILEPYGGLGASGRKDQQSHFYISEEFNQLRQMATIIPTIFLGVAAFLLNVVIGRLIQTQQGQIATLKAFGYTNTEIGWHYVKMVSVIVIIGLTGGVFLGMYLGKLLAGVYADFYRFPFLRFHLDSRVLLAAVLVSFGAALAGVIFAVRRAVVLPPAQGMLPETPQIFKQNFFEKIGLADFLDQPTKMILRQLSRHRLKAVFSIIGIAFAASLVMIGRMSHDSVNFAVDVEFRRAQPYDLSVSFEDAVSSHAISELRRMPGVYYAEEYRSLPVRMRFGHRTYLTGIQAYPRDRKLKPLLDANQQEVSLPEYGIVLTQRLGTILGLQTGDTLRVEILENSRRTLDLPVAGFMNQYFGLSGYMSLEELDRVLPEKGLVSGAFLNIDKSFEERITRELKESPRVAEILSTQGIIQRFYESTAQTWLIMAFFVSLFAAATAFSVVYNNARISLSERNRELASLRVLGFTRGEISYILLGELWFVVLAAIPVGMACGWALTAFIIWSLQTDLYRIPLNISSTTYALAALTVIISALLSSVVLRRRLNKLNLIEVLKTRE
ncbi:MAG: FtsX-like permease family protein [Balneolaceae bacterium]|jgi:putative ABC transport system permease protein